MSQLAQIFWGSTVLALCCLVHVTAISLGAGLVARTAKKLNNKYQKTKVAVLLTEATAFLVAAHTVQVWLWALMLFLFGVIVDFYDAVYFSLVTYTTVGYGDIVLPEGFRIFGAFAGVTGLLVFGLSTAFLGALLVRILSDTYTGLQKSGD